MTEGMTGKQVGTAHQASKALLAEYDQWAAVRA
jgi:hypothetical protein